MRLKALMAGFVSVLLLLTVSSLAVADDDIDKVQVVNKVKAKIVNTPDVNVANIPEVHVLNDAESPVPVSIQDAQGPVPVFLKWYRRNSMFSGYRTLPLYNYNVCVGLTPACDSQADYYVVPDSHYLVIHQIAIKCRVLLGTNPEGCAGELQVLGPFTVEWNFGNLDFYDASLTRWGETFAVNIVALSGSKLAPRVDFRDFGPDDVEASMTIYAELVSEN